MDEKKQMFWLQFRQGLLVIVGAIETILDIAPTTSDLRKRWREEYINRSTVTREEDERGG